MELFSSVLCWLWPLIAGIICGILGYLLGRLTSPKNEVIDYSEDLKACESKVTSLQEELDTCNSKTASLQTDLDDCKRNADLLQVNLNNCNTKLKAAQAVPPPVVTPTPEPPKVTPIPTPEPPVVTPIPTPDVTDSVVSNVSSFAAGAATSGINTGGVTSVPFDADAAKAAFGKKVKEDDLTVVEGIGPKISELFNTNGVTTWAELANTPVDRCQEILNIGGKRYEIHKPGSWPKQAKMAALGQWTTLKKWQDLHDYGRE